MEFLQEVLLYLCFFFVAPKPGQAKARIPM